ncbi:PREDICTED: F-box/LRR-repeat protein At3g26922-like isoform X4 [Erythranthe guttata]|uniref:F-box/LRR-repeat protein At3g26922-like isoform X4 n=1 Tax=Erythranthe guttata TaxID=4155 RepID=UPI00064DF34E|nr:PREDICTED: F-box/LRR-repeat protein At3g26922-like isoform X4 [Erythranthe guttata]|eukprot:XP_012846639.1 PREDICTED: F-box/LRR-repeat protein At3g26922-like isoform X4 [Erythranthe guttata]
MTSSMSVAAVNSDRISGLKDEILVRILSFLPTQTCVSTSILSRRWRFLWASVPSIIFEYTDCEDSIYRAMLLQRVENINTLCISGWKSFKWFQFDTWITVAITRNVQNIDLNIEHDGDFIPRCLFNCKTLVDLRLVWCGVIPTVPTACLPRLKNLRLIAVTFEDDDTLNHLLSGCPLLEELELQLIRESRNNLYCNISSPTIERLTVTFRFIDSEPCECRLRINAPSLRYLQISDRIGDESRLYPLFEASIYLHMDNSKQLDLFYPRSVLKFIDWLGLLDARSLQLDLSSYCSGLCKIEEFTRSFINSLNEVSEEGKSWIWIEPLHVPKCLLSHLRVVKILKMADETKMFEFVKYLLRHAQVLERIELAYSVPVKSEEKILMQEISSFERASKACEIAFVAAAAKEADSDDE